MAASVDSHGLVVFGYEFPSICESIEVNEIRRVGLILSVVSYSERAAFVLHFPVAHPIEEKAGHERSRPVDSSAPATIAAPVFIIKPSGGTLEILCCEAS